MKVYLQIVDSNTGIYQCGMIEEPVIKNQEIANALGHFGIQIGSLSWIFKNEKYGIAEVDGTSKICTLIYL